METKILVKRFTKLLYPLLALLLSSCGGDSVELQVVKPPTEEETPTSQEPVVEEPVVQPPAVETPVIEPEEPVVEKPVVVEPSTVVDPTPDLSTLQIELISNRRVEKSENSELSIDFRVTDGSKSWSTDEITNSFIAFSSSESTAKIGSFQPKSDGTYSLNISTESSGETVITVIYTENPISETSVLLRVIPEAPEEELKRFCEVSDSSGYSSISDTNRGDGRATAVEEISLNSRVPITSGDDNSRVTVLYRELNSETIDSFATKTLFYRDPTERLVATIGYSKSLVGSSFYLIYINVNGDEVCTEMATFPTSAVLESGGDEIVIREQMPTIGDM
jgi:hypothetical protein